MSSFEDVNHAKVVAAYRQYRAASMAERRSHATTAASPLPSSPTRTSVMLRRDLRALQRTDSSRKLREAMKSSAHTDVAVDFAARTAKALHKRRQLLLQVQQQQSNCIVQLYASH